MLPVALALLGTGARRPTVAFLGWFGPRGLASIVFAVIVVQEAHLPHANDPADDRTSPSASPFSSTALTAAPLTDRYARWYETHPRDAAPPMESAPAIEHPARGSPL